VSGCCFKLEPLNICQRKIKLYVCECFVVTEASQFKRRLNCVFVCVCVSVNLLMLLATGATKFKRLGYK
jgi:hypothetical protein